MTGSEFPYTETGCECGARFNCDNYSQEVSTITEVPDITYQVSISAHKEYDFEDADTPAEAKQAYIDAIKESPEDELDSISVNQPVSKETIREVLDAGINGDGVDISSNSFDVEDIEAHGVTVPKEMQC